MQAGPPGPKDASADLGDYRNGPGGPLLTVKECKERFGISGPALSKHKRAKATRRKHPYGGRGYVYRYDVVSLIANQKP